MSKYDSFDDLMNEVINDWVERGCVMSAPAILGMVKAGIDHPVFIKITNRRRMTPVWMWIESAEKKMSEEVMNYDYATNSISFDKSKVIEVAKLWEYRTERLMSNFKNLAYSLGKCPEQKEEIIGFMDDMAEEAKQWL